MSDSVIRYRSPNLNRATRRRLPGLLGRIEDDLLRSGVVAEELVVTILISVASLICQGVANVAWVNGRKLSLSVSGIVVSETVTCKSLLLEILMHAIIALLKQKKAAADEFVPSNLSIDSGSRVGILEALSDYPILGVITDEGEQIQDLMKNSTAILAKLLKGEEILSARYGKKRLALANYKFCMALLMQPDVFKRIAPSLGLGEGGVGLGNRYAIAFAEPNYSPVSRNEVFLSSEVETAYTVRIDELLDACLLNARNGFESLPTIYLSEDGKEYLLQLENIALRNCIPGGKWEYIRTYQGRYVERVLSRAGLMHVFEYGPVGEISVETLERAEALVDWYTASYIKGTYKPPEPPKRPQEEVDADTLEFGVFNHFYKPDQLNVFTEAVLRTFAINLGLTRTRFNKAVAVLGGRGSIIAFNEERTMKIYLVPPHIWRK